MAKCDLSIELDDAERVYFGGEKIAGKVHVRADANVQCSGLEVRTVWKTHGRGNVATGTSEAVTVFTGAWNAGEKVEYPFELTVAVWPPTYHGHHLNIDHYVEAQAKIPWSFDPQASAMFLMRPNNTVGVPISPASAAVSNGVVQSIVAAVAAMFMLVFCVASAANPIVMVIFGLIAIAVITFWMVRVVLPKYRLGEVSASLDQATFAPGDAVAGKLSIRPRRNVTINGIELKFEAREQCVSGSGSNKTTHRHVIFETLQSLSAPTTLSADQPHEFPFAVEIPRDAVYSIDLSDNDLIWSANLRVDIPRWPDWRMDLPLVVLPAVGGGDAIRSPLEHQTASPLAADVAISHADDSVVTFEETAKHLWKVRDNPDAAKMLADAVTGLSFKIQATLERRLLYSGEDDPHVYPNGYAIWARHTEPPLPLVIYVPRELGDEFEQLGEGNWEGQATVVGWDRVHRRLQIKIDRP